jgi:hypothetical protein
MAPALEAMPHRRQAGLAALDRQAPRARQARLRLPGADHQVTTRTSGSRKPARLVPESASL